MVPSSLKKSRQVWIGFTLWISMGGSCGNSDAVCVGGSGSSATAVGSTPAPLPSGPVLTLSDSFDTPAPRARFVRIETYPAHIGNEPGSLLNKCDISLLGGLGGQAFLGGVDDHYDAAP
jgi:hypothetical protein